MVCGAGRTAGCRRVGGGEVGREPAVGFRFGDLVPALGRATELEALGPGMAWGFGLAATGYRGFRVGDRLMRTFMRTLLRTDQWFVVDLCY